MKAIDTFYNGNYFRSRLEARWAVFFDGLGVRYEYEPEGFENEKTGERYLPDFYLPDTYLRGLMQNLGIKGVYIEIKPESFEEDEISAMYWFDKPLVLFKGIPINNLWCNQPTNGLQLHPFWDNYMGLWICVECSTTKIEFMEGHYNDCPVCHKRGNNGPLLVEVAKKATMKRFEHGVK